MACCNSTYTTIIFSMSKALAYLYGVSYKFSYGCFCHWVGGAYLMFPCYYLAFFFVESHKFLYDIDIGMLGIAPHNEREREICDILS